MRFTIRSFFIITFFLSLIFMAFGTPKIEYETNGTVISTKGLVFRSSLKCYQENVSWAISNNDVNDVYNNYFISVFSIQMDNGVNNIRYSVYDKPLMLFYTSLYFVVFVLPIIVFWAVVLKRCCGIK